MRRIARLSAAAAASVTRDGRGRNKKRRSQQQTNSTRELFPTQPKRPPPQPGKSVKKEPSLDLGKTDLQDVRQLIQWLHRVRRSFSTVREASILQRVTDVSFQAFVRMVVPHVTLSSNSPVQILVVERFIPEKKRRAIDVTALASWVPSCYVFEGQRDIWKAHIDALRVFRLLGSSGEVLEVKDALHLLSSFVYFDRVMSSWDDPSYWLEAKTSEQTGSTTDCRSVVSLDDHPVAIIRLWINVLTKWLLLANAANSDVCYGTVGTLMPPFHDVQLHKPLPHCPLSLPVLSSGPVHPGFASVLRSLVPPILAAVADQIAALRPDEVAVALHGTARVADVLRTAAAPPAEAAPLADVAAALMRRAAALRPANAATAVVGAAAACAAALARLTGDVGRFAPLAIAAWAEAVPSGWNTTVVNCPKRLAAVEGVGDVLRQMMRSKAYSSNVDAMVSLWGCLPERTELVFWNWLGLTTNTQFFSFMQMRYLQLSHRMAMPSIIIAAAAAFVAMEKLGSKETALIKSMADNICAAIVRLHRELQHADDFDRQPLEEMKSLPLMHQHIKTSQLFRNAAVKHQLKILPTSETRSASGDKSDASPSVDAKGSLNLDESSRNLSTKDKDPDSINSQQQPTTEKESVKPSAIKGEATSALRFSLSENPRDQIREATSWLRNNAKSRKQKHWDFFLKYSVDMVHQVSGSSNPEFFMAVVAILSEATAACGDGRFIFTNPSQPTEGESEWACVVRSFKARFSLMKHSLHTLVFAVALEIVPPTSILELIDSSMTTLDSLFSEERSALGTIFDKEATIFRLLKAHFTTKGEAGMYVRAWENLGEFLAKQLCGISETLGLTFLGKSKKPPTVNVALRFCRMCWRNEYLSDETIHESLAPNPQGNIAQELQQWISTTAYLMVHVITRVVRSRTITDSAEQCQLGAMVLFGSQLASTLLPRGADRLFLWMAFTMSRLDPLIVVDLLGERPRTLLEVSCPQKSRLSAQEGPVVLDAICANAVETVQSSTSTSLIPALLRFLTASELLRRHEIFIDAAKPMQQPTQTLGNVLRGWSRQLQQNSGSTNVDVVPLLQLLILMSASQSTETTVIGIIFVLVDCPLTYTEMHACMISMSRVMLHIAVPRWCVSLVCRRVLSANPAVFSGEVSAMYCMALRFLAMVDGLDSPLCMLLSNRIVRQWKRLSSADIGVLLQSCRHAHTPISHALRMEILRRLRESSWDDTAAWVAEAATVFTGDRELWNAIEESASAAGRSNDPVVHEARCESMVNVKADEP